VWDLRDIFGNIEICESNAIFNAYTVWIVYAAAIPSLIRTDENVRRLDILVPNLLPMNIDYSL
jgi:hypothetical protein